MAPVRHTSGSKVRTRWQTDPLASRVTRRQRRPSVAEVASAAGTEPVIDLYLLCRLSVQEAVDGESLEAQVRQAKSDAADVLGFAADRITFVEADSDAIPEVAGPIGSDGVYAHLDATQSDRHKFTLSSNTGRTSALLTASPS